MANILVITNEAILLVLISTTLRLDGHTVVALSDPLEALESEVAPQPPIDLLVTDIEMKPISGFELVTRLTKTGFTGPVLFSSGYPSLSSIVSASLGSRSILEKPFTAAQLRVAVRSALTRDRRKPSVAA